MYPRLLHIYGPLWIQSYGVMIALGFLVFLFCAYRHPLRKKIVNDETFFNTLFIGLLAGIVGGRLLFVVTSFYEFADNWLEMFFPWIGGFVVSGSIVGVLVAVPLYLYIKKVSALQFFDIAAIYGPLMHAIARLGCLFAGCCYGAPTSLPWAITFTDPAGSGPLGIALHPSQLYAALASFTIFLLIRFVATQRLKRPGQLLFLYLCLENVSRFSVDFLRGDRETLQKFIFWDLSHVQFLSLVFFAISVIGLVWVSQRKNANN